MNTTFIEVTAEKLWKLNNKLSSVPENAPDFDSLWSGSKEFWIKFAEGINALISRQQTAKAESGEWEEAWGYEAKEKGWNRHECQYRNGLGEWIDCGTTVPQDGFNVDMTKEHGRLYRRKRPSPQPSASPETVQGNGPKDILGPVEPTREPGADVGREILLLVDTITACRNQFRKYSNLHLAKNTEEGRKKAAVNNAFASRCTFAMVDGKRLAERVLRQPTIHISAAVEQDRPSDFPAVQQGQRIEPITMKKIIAAPGQFSEEFYVRCAERANALLSHPSPEQPKELPAQDDGFRKCEFCGCNTNAKMRACCKRGREADSQPPAEPSSDTLATVVIDTHSRTWDSQQKKIDALTEQLTAERTKVEELQGKLSTEHILREKAQHERGKVEKERDELQAQVGFPARHEFTLLVCRGCGRKDWRVRLLSIHPPVFYGKPVGPSCTQENKEPACADAVPRS